MPTGNDSTGVRIELGGFRYVRELADALANFEEVYNGLYVFFDITSDIEKLPVWPVVLYPNLPKAWRRRRIATWLPGSEGEDLSVYIHPEDQLVLRSCRIGSPGIVEVLGVWNPLEVLRRWVQDSHERRKERGREELEREGLQLRNELLRNEVIHGRIAALQEAGIPKTEIKSYIRKLLYEPTHALDLDLRSGVVRTISSLE